jgi:hypothetical protein
MAGDDDAESGATELGGDGGVTGVFGSDGAGTGCDAAASQQVFALPEPVHSVRAAHWVASTIAAEQPNFPAEIGV